MTSGPDYRIDLQPKHLRHFLAVVECGSISAACEVLNITQPALSKSIRQLELRLGIDLFERLPSGVELTRYGRIFARRARLMEMEYRHALAEIDAAKTGAAGSINVGVGPGWVDTILPLVIANFQKSHPKTRYHIETGVIDTLIPRVKDGELDVVCCSLDFPDHPELVKFKLSDMKHVIFSGTEHPLARKADVTAADMVSYPWIFPSDDHVGRARLKSFFAAHELPPPDIRAEIDSGFTAILKYVSQGGFLLSAPEIFVREANVQGLRIVSRDEKLWKTPAGLVYRATDKPNPLRKSFIEQMKTQFRLHFPDAQNVE